MWLSTPWQLHARFREQASHTFRKILDALALDSAVVAGNSLGALWATWLALAHPDRVRGLVLLGPSIGFPGVRPPAFMRIAALPGVGALIKRSMKTTHASLRKMFASMGHRESVANGKIPDELLDWGVRLDDTGTPRHDFDAVLRAVGVAGPRRWIQLSDHELKALSVPTLLVGGTHDPEGGTALAARVAELIPRATLVSVEGAGHLPWLEDARVVGDAILRFVTAA